MGWGLEGIFIGFLFLFFFFLKKKSGIIFLIVMWFVLVSRVVGFWFEDGMFDFFDKIF